MLKELFNYIGLSSLKVRDMVSAIKKPKSKHRKAKGSWLRFNRKNRLDKNPELAYKPEHPFKPIKELFKRKVNDGHKYERDIKKMKLGKLKPKQQNILNYKLRSAGIIL